MQESIVRRAKIVCTLGPSTASYEKILEMIHSGLDVARLNFSHGDHPTHQKIFNWVRKASQEAKRNVAIMQDLQGPKLRLGELKEPIKAKPGECLFLYPEGKKAVSSWEHDHLIPMSAEISDIVSKDASVGDSILFDDGKISTKIQKVAQGEVLVEVIHGGPLSSHKGMNLPDTPLSFPALSEKDKKDLLFGLEMGVDAVALSFVRSANDIETVRALIQKSSSLRPLLVSKIERPEALESYEEIIAVSDVILIARGDMAVEVGAERVPMIQKQLIQECSHLGVPVITATQMLESMIQSPVPTRAEANDVANAVFDGTDAVMLSGETASGEYPIESIRMMSKIICEAEGYLEDYSVRPPVLPTPGIVVDSIEMSASRIATHLDVVAIACLTHSGMAARALAKYRPEKPIVAIMDQPDTLRKLSFVWGVQGVLIPELKPTDDLFSLIEQKLLESNWVKKGDQFVLTAGVPSLKRGTTNMIKVQTVGAAIERSMTNSVLRS